MKRGVPIFVALLAIARFASGGNQSTLHEQIPIDARDDIVMGVVLEGDIPAAIETRSGIFSAPNLNKPPTSSELAANAGAESQAMQGAVGNTFTPDRDTRRPNVLRYVDPFTPATAPFKRLVAFDAVDGRFALYTYYPRLTTLAVDHGRANATEDVFYGDIAVDVGPEKHARIPSVGPGARVLHAHLAAGARELPIMLAHDGADNWFVDSNEPAAARLVIELAIARTAFGGELGDPDWSALGVPPVPVDVADAAKTVIAHIGLGRQMRPNENVRRMVAYFRAFVDSDRPLEASKDVYTDLALSQKGVCRHRAYAFTITAIALGIPTRMVMNEAHAWVEVFDGSSWRRIDLGGAGQMLSQDANAAEPYAGPNDSFPWPANASRGDDLNDPSRTFRASPNGNGNGGSSASPNPSTSATESSTSSSTTSANGGNETIDSRTTSNVAIDVTEADATRGTPLHVHGTVTSNGDACASVTVNVILRDAKSKREARIGTVATDSKGVFAAPIILPSAVPLGDYDVIAHTDGDARCGRGTSK